jgi:hypothetical protein
MKYYLPQISWHDRSAILSLDFQLDEAKLETGRYKLVTSSVANEVRVCPRFLLSSIQFYTYSEDATVYVEHFYLANLLPKTSSILRLHFLINFRCGNLALTQKRSWKLAVNPRSPSISSQIWAVTTALSMLFDSLRTVCTLLVMLRAYH